MFVRIKDVKSFLLFPDSPREQWPGELGFYFGCLVTALCGGLLAVGALSPNLRPVTKTDWRARTCRSIVALVSIDVLVLNTMDFAIQIMGEGEVCSSRAGK